MSFCPIYYVSLCTPTIDRTLGMIDKYAAHGARSIQLDMPAENPIYESLLVKSYMKTALSIYDGYEPYMIAIAAIGQKHPGLKIHLVVYPEVIQAIGAKEFLCFAKANRLESVMVAGGDPKTIDFLKQSGIAVIARISRDLDDESLRQARQASPDSYFNFNYKRHREIEPHGLKSFAERVSYIRAFGVKARILAVEGIADGEMMAEVKAAGCDGALLGNALMSLWDDEDKLWKAFDEFQCFEE